MDAGRTHFHRKDLQVGAYAVARLARGRIEVEAMPWTNELSIIEPGALERAALMRTEISDSEQCTPRPHKPDITLAHGYSDGCTFTQCLNAGIIHALPPDPFHDLHSANIRALHAHIMHAQAMQ